MMQVIKQLNRVDKRGRNLIFITWTSDSFSLELSKMEVISRAV